MGPWGLRAKGVIPLSFLVDTPDRGVGVGVSHCRISIGSQVLLISMMGTLDMQGIQNISLTRVDPLLRGRDPSYDCVREMSWVLVWDRPQVVGNLILQELNFSIYDLPSQGLLSPLVP